MSTARSTSVSQLVTAPRAAVYKAFIEARTVAAWLCPPGITAKVHVFEPRPGGAIRMSLTYKHPSSAQRGKTTEDTDTFQGRFVELHPTDRVAQVFVFESPDPGFAGEMKFIADLIEAPGGTAVTITCEDIPPGIALADNELGTRLSLQNLAALFA